MSKKVTFQGYPVAVFQCKNTTFLPRTCPNYNGADRLGRHAYNAPLDKPTCELCWAEVIDQTKQHPDVLKYDKPGHDYHCFFCGDKLERVRFFPTRRFPTEGEVTSQEATPAPIPQPPAADGTDTPHRKSSGTRGRKRHWA